jgi:hypothetical protein
MHSKYIALSSALCEVIPLHRLLAKMLHVQREPHQSCTALYLKTTMPASLWLTLAA